MPEPQLVESAHEELSFVRRYIFSTDHKVIGIQYFLTSIFMGVVAGSLAMIMRIHLASGPEATWPILSKIFPGGIEGGVMKPEFYLSIMTMHGTLMVFFVISLALLGGFGNYLIPLMVGARDMAFPFLNMLSYWVIFLASVIMLGSLWAEGGSSATGWTAYPPLSAVEAAGPGSGLGMTLWLLAMALFIVSFTMGGLNYFATILGMRTKGLTMMRLPLTIWTMFLASGLGLLAFPPLTAAAVMLLLDRHGATSFYLPAGLFFGSEVLPHEGGTPLLWQHLFWFLGHPEVYVLLLPALGMTFDVLAPFIRKPVFGYRTTIYCLGIISALSIVVWGHHMYVSGMSPYLGEFFTVGTLLITLPSAIVGVNLLASLWGAAIRLRTPMMFAIGVIVLFGAGGFGGIFLGNATSDIFLHDSYFVVGHFHFMIGGVTLFGIFAATYYWFPKMFGKALSETLGKIHFWFTLIPFYSIFLLQHFLGFGGMPRRYYDFSKYEFLEQFASLNITVSHIAYVLGVGQLLFVANVIWTLWRGKQAENNPWDATTLEWETPSPPPHGNFGSKLPEVHRWAYDYNLPDEEQDFFPQTASANEAAVTQ